MVGQYYFFSPLFKGMNMKIVYLFTDKTKKLTEHNLYHIDNMVDAYELILDLISMEIQRENNFTDKENNSAVKFNTGTGNKLKQG